MKVGPTCVTEVHNPYDVPSYQMQNETIMYMAITIKNARMFLE